MWCSGSKLVFWGVIYQTSAKSKIKPKLALCFLPFPTLHQNRIKKKKRVADSEQQATASLGLVLLFYNHPSIYTQNMDTNYFPKAKQYKNWNWGKFDSTLSPIIMKAKNGCIWKVTIIGWTHLFTSMMMGGRVCSLNRWLNSRSNRPFAAAKLPTTSSLTGLETTKMRGSNGKKRTWYVQPELSRCVSGW